ncbi:hypothetical protein BD779DRAFT_1668195 [Infundibulicybe gibba]|nr:hypothetical protein BD779DRAFT_1668195 [Infundibulicybe gibba]
MLAISSLVSWARLYLGCFKLRKSTTSRADIETNETGASDKAINEPKLMENCDKSMSNPSAISTFPLPPSSATLIFTPLKAYTTTRGGGCPHEPRGIYVGSQWSPSTPAHFSRETLPH